MLQKLVIVLLVYIVLSVVVADAKREATRDMISANALDSKAFIMVVDIDKTLVAPADERGGDTFTAENTLIVFRPDIDFFFKNFSKIFYIVLYTTARKEYAEAIFNELNKRNSGSVMEFRHFQNCQPTDDRDTVHTKSLDYIMTPDQKLKAFIVGDALSYTHKQNGQVIQIAEWNNYKFPMPDGDRLKVGSSKTFLGLGHTKARSHDKGSAITITRLDIPDDHLFDLAKYLATHFLVLFEVDEMPSGETGKIVRRTRYQNAVDILKANPYKNHGDGHVKLEKKRVVDAVERFQNYCSLMLNVDSKTYVR